VGASTIFDPILLDEKATPTEDGALALGTMCILGFSPDIPDINIEEACFLAEGESSF